MFGVPQVKNMFPLFFPFMLKRKHYNKATITLTTQIEVINVMALLLLWRGFLMTSRWIRSRLSSSNLIKKSFSFESIRTLTASMMKETYKNDSTVVNMEQLGT